MSTADTLGKLSLGLSPDVPCAICQMTYCPTPLFPGHVDGYSDRATMLLVMKVPLAVCGWFFPSAGLLWVTALRSVSAIISAIISLHGESSAIVALADHHPTLCELTGVTSAEFCSGGTSTGIHIS